MSISSFVVDAAPNRFFDSDDGGVKVPDELPASPGSTLEEKLEVAYLERASRYKQEIQQGYKQVRWGDFPWPDTYPTVKVSLPGGTETVVFDEELDARLMELYVLHGWDGILRLEQGLEAAQETRETRYTQPWFVVLPFYLFTRNRLILLVRQALIEIERKASEDAIARLSVTTVAVGTAWETKFAFSTERIKARRFKNEASFDTPNPYETAYVMGNRGLSDSLFPLMTETVDLRAVLDAQTRKKDYLEGLVAAGEKHGSIELDIADLERSIGETRATLRTLYGRIAELEPLVLLAVPLLKGGFEKPEMENVIGETLQPLHRKLDKLREAINPQTSRVEAEFEGIREDAPVGKLESLFPLGYDIELLCAEKAISKLDSDPAYLVLLSEESLNRLVSTDAIEAGTLAYFVCKRYVLTLMEQIEKNREFEEALERAVAKLVSAVSIVSLVVPQLRVASAVLGLPAFVYQTYSVVHRLSLLDQMVNQRLLEASTADIGSLSAVGEIVAQRSEYGQQITEAILTEIGLLIAGGRWAAFKRGLYLRGYYSDLETLLEG
ncbi:MAG: hypothetical protein CYG60_16965 [Actinobacteria bacterium]|nr:MAG: hypothetical protein CYG60_16965 [Actinomycetota bacterium]